MDAMAEVITGSPNSPAGRPGSFRAPSPLPGMGASVDDRGCTFRVWAPFADAVFVAGDFTNPSWEAGRIRLERDASSGPGSAYWSAFVPDVADGAEYRFIIERGGETLWKMDPYCRDATATNGNSVVHNPAFDWGSDGFGMPNWNELVLYELHVGTFNNDPQSGIGTFAELMEELDYLRGLGINAVKIMPAADFDTETSMGYNPSLPFAVEDAYGDSKALRKFIRAAHADGIAVIFDVVYNHFGPEGLEQCLGRFDGWHLPGKQGIYFYPDERSITDWGDDVRPDFGRPEVRQLLRDNAMMWLHDYRADGLRLDSTINIRRAVGKGGDRGEIAEGWSLLQWISNDKNDKQAWKILIAEDLQDNEWITKPTGAGGAGCDSQWDLSFFHAIRDAVVQPFDERRDMQRVRRAIDGRYNGDAFGRVIFSESHDEVTVQNGRDLGRMPRKINWHDPEGRDARKRSILAAALVFTSPGIPMIFQGQEFYEYETWTDRTPLDWSKEQRFGGILNLYRDLIRLRLNRNHNTRGLCGQHVNVFHVNDEAKVIAFHRWADGGPGDDVIVVANFSNRAYDSYKIGFPRGGAWWLRFNSDWRGYCGDFDNIGYDTTATAGTNQGMPFSGNVGLSAYGAAVFSQ